MTVKTMKLDYKTRQSGKTTRLISWLAGSEKRVMIVSSLAEKDGLIQRFPFAPVKTQVFTMSEWEKMRHGRRDYELAVDNAEFVLERLLGSPIARMSMTKETKQHGKQTMVA